MKNLKLSGAILATLVLMSSAVAAYGQQPQPPTKSAESSPSSGTRVSSEQSAVSGQPKQKASILSACNAAADELRASWILIDALERENTALKQRLETEKLTTGLLTELIETRRRESDALKQTVAAKNETIAAKDVAIAAQDKLVENLKSKKRGIWSRLGDILIGAGIAAVVR